jgi:hypothetical protein
MSFMRQNAIVSDRKPEVYFDVAAIDVCPLAGRFCGALPDTVGWL